MMEVSLIFVICASVLLFVDFVFRIYKKFEIIKMGKQKATAASRKSTLERNDIVNHRTRIVNRVNAAASKHFIKNYATHRGISKEGTRV